jgi:hypothetical protein
MLLPGSVGERGMPRRRRVIGVGQAADDHALKVRMRTPLYQAVQQRDDAGRPQHELQDVEVRHGADAQPPHRPPRQVGRPRAAELVVGEDVLREHAVVVVRFRVDAAVGDELVVELAPRIGREGVAGEVVHAGHRDARRENERLQHVTLGLTRHAEDQMTPGHHGEFHGRAHRAEHAWQLHFLLDPGELGRRPAFGGIGEGSAAAPLHPCQHLGVERLGARPGRHAPLDVELLVDEDLRELDDPVTADDHREVLELEVAGAERGVIVRHLVDDLTRLASDPLGAEHLRARAERALVGTAARRQHRHAARGEGVVGELVVEVVRERHRLPVRPRDRVDVGQATAGRGLPHRAGRVAHREPGDAVERQALAEMRGELDDGLLALAEHATEHLGDALQEPFVVGARVLPAHDERHVRERRRDHRDGPAAVDPRVREHAADADQVDAGRDAVDHLLGDEPVDPVAVGIARDHVRRLAEGVDDAHPVARLLERRRR